MRPAMNGMKVMLISILCAGALNAAPVIAGVVVAEDDVRAAPPMRVLPNPVNSSSSATKTKQTRKSISIDEIDETTALSSKKFTLRCWQNGLLIVERQVDDLPPESSKVVPLDAGREAVKDGAKDAAKDMSNFSGNRSGMRLFDLRNSTCLLQ